MAKIRVGRLGRLLLIVVAVVLALPLVANGAYGERAAAAPARSGTAGAGSPDTAPTASDAAEHPEKATDRCQPRRSGRSTATVAVPTPSGTPVSTAQRVRTEAGPAGINAALTGRQAVPLSRSGELPVHHLVFRC
ncbi:hypothetical protein AB0C96_15105 [Streptomyces sp. NPDC048506]|uniref:hypothetical protein n=1 Tax=Streptomyces sp. NPDC048506 TaxID=3155028 RepID=UPI00344AAB7D